MMWGWFRQENKQRIRVHHGYRDEIGGPFVKLERMNRYFPNYDKGYNLVYGVSGTNLPVRVLEQARKKRMPVVCHMNSCWHPAYADDYEDKNHHLKCLHNEYACYAVYGSQQAMRGAERYLGKLKGAHQLIYNAVDTQHFKPGEKQDTSRPVILAAGLHQFRHRLEPLIEAMPLVAEKLNEPELVIAGKLVPGEGIFDCGEETIRRIIERVGYERVRFIDAYTQSEAPEIYSQADVLVHLKHMDWTPNVVAEAMSCGVPVVHTGNGGTPEIVGDAGVSLEIEENWDQIISADPESVAGAIVEAYESREALTARARARAEEFFDLEDWIERHREIFESLVESA
ncbi:MAG: glycosyltransferase family 4 protein [Verrucomicrobiota bacterium]